MDAKVDWADRLDQLADNSGPILATAVKWLNEARKIDPSESGIAAEVRDAIRDNYDPALDDEDPELWAQIEGPEMSWCPLDGDQEVKGHASTGGPDPYDIEKLACGHKVVWMSGKKEDCHVL